MTDLQDTKVPFGMNAHEIILEHVSSLDIPVCLIFPVATLMTIGL